MAKPRNAKPKVRRRKLQKRSGTHDHHHPHHAHIHCIACGKHLDVEVFGEPDGADWMRCEHGTDYPHCLACADRARALLQQHDESGEPVQRARAWH